MEYAGSACGAESGCWSAPALQCARCSGLLMADRSDVRWLDPIDPNRDDLEPSSETATVMPIFPLGVTYLPYTTTVLNILVPVVKRLSHDKARLAAALRRLLSSVTVTHSGWHMCQIS